MGGWGRCSDEVQGVSLHRRQALRRVLSASQLCSRREGDRLAQLRAGLQLSSTGRRFACHWPQGLIRARPDGWPTIVQAGAPAALQAQRASLLPPASHQRGLLASPS